MKIIKRKIRRGLATILALTITTNIQSQIVEESGTYNMYSIPSMDIGSEIYLTSTIFDRDNKINYLAIDNEIYDTSTSSLSSIIWIALINNEWNIFSSKQGVNTNLWDRKSSSRNQQILTAAETLDDEELTGTTSANYDAAPPPNDPIDIPIDGGVSILLTIAAVLEYKRRNTLPLFRFAQHDIRNAR